MDSNYEKGLDREAPYSHVIQGIFPIIYIIIWLLDSIILNLSTILNTYIPSYIRIILFGIVILISIIIGYLSHKQLFHDNEPSNVLITHGILGYIRNPLYLSILLLYLALLFLSISLISTCLFILIFLIYNWMVNCEERILEDIFGEQYREYKKKVPKWIPKLI
ncbi:MAG: DUF1295 domain-containing protein [Candidatus Lokiarchaeota archaeon]|nr:DUF1295 domain-containing protein [Candidatus Lokiarchaeota archaeon]